MWTLNLRYILCNYKRLQVLFVCIDLNDRLLKLHKRNNCLHRMRSLYCAFKIGTDWKLDLLTWQFNIIQFCVDEINKCIVRLKIMEWFYLKLDFYLLSITLYREAHCNTVATYLFPRRINQHPISVQVAR